MDIALLDVLAVGEHGIALGNDVDVLQANTVDRHLWQAIEFHSTSGTIADNILDIGHPRFREDLNQLQYPATILTCQPAQAAAAA